MCYDIWYHETRSLVKEQKDPPGLDTHAFSPDLQFLAYLSRTSGEAVEGLITSVEIWDVVKDVIHKRIILPKDYVYHTSYTTIKLAHKTSLVVVKLDNNDLIILDAATSELVITYKGEFGLRITYKDFLEDDRLVIAIEKTLDENMREYRIQTSASMLQPRQSAHMSKADPKTLIPRPKPSILQTADVDDL